jgi:hypothetical protein
MGELCIKCIDLSFTLNETFTHAWFCTLYIGHLENIDSLYYIDFVNIGIFSYIIKNLTFVNVTTNLIRKKEMCSMIGI